MGLGDWEPGSLGEGSRREDGSRSKLQQRGVSGEVQRRREDMELYAASGSAVSMSMTLHSLLIASHASLSCR